MFKTSEFNFSPIDIVSTNWLTIVLTGILVLIALIFVLYRRKMSLILQSLFVQRHYSQIVREGKLLNEHIYFLNLIMVFLTQGVLFYFIIEQLFPNFYLSYTSWVSSFNISNVFYAPILYTACVLFIIAGYFFKQSFMLFYTYIFDYEDERYDYSLHRFFSLIASSITLYILFVIAIYTKIYAFLWVYFAIFIIIYLIMAYRLFTLNTKKVNPFHFFIYFCTFEITPYLILAKLLFSLDTAQILDI